jgi:DNA-binding CsgD family transcriptional regulator
MLPRNDKSCGAGLSDDNMPALEQDTQYGTVANSKSLLDMFGLGVVIFSEMKAIYVNNQAKEILANNDGLCLDSGLRLRAMRKDEDRALQALLRASHNILSSTERAGHGLLAISRLTEGQFYPIAVSKLYRDGSSSDLPGGDVVAFIRDTRSLGSIGWDAVANAYSLTKSEIRLIKCLVDGHTPEDAAREMKINVSTARWHLKQIFEKTGTNRQAELVRLILGMSLPLRL